MSHVVHLVRHGRAAAGWDVDPDPPLDETGRRQAMQVASRFAGREPIAVVSSPLLRCQQTAFPLAAVWGVEVAIEPRVAEIPSPPEFDVTNRGGWLTEAMAGTWSGVATRSGAVYDEYRRGTGEALRDLGRDAVVFSHFVAINAIIGLATGDDRMVVARLDNCSVTTVAVRDDGSLEVLETGREADTIVR